MSDVPGVQRVALYALSTAVFAQRDGAILVLKRAAGEATGGWFVPGGAVDLGETVEEGARRELLEESGLSPTSRLTSVAVAHMRVYSQETLQVFYACDCAEGDVILSDEHSGARWVDPVAYRDRYFSEDVIRQFAAGSNRVMTMLTNIREAIDCYLEYCKRASVRAS